MTFLDLLADKKTTVYSLSNDSGVPKTTLTDIASGKADILECSGKTLLAISKALNVTIEDLLSLEREEAKSLLAMAIGVGVAVGSNSEAVPVHAADPTANFAATNTTAVQNQEGDITIPLYINS